MSAEERRLRWVLIAVGAGWTVFFLAMVTVAVFEWIPPSSTAGRLLLWGDAGTEYLLMMCAINVVIGAALLIAARAPAEHSQTIGLCLAINLAHMATMLLLAATGDHDHLHLLGDVVLGIVPNLVLALAWVPVRQQRRTPESATSVVAG